ncbi:hypothetical protein B0I32_1581 [Nonomuraea fuscirosea]|uniref:EvbL n=2 Tax=Nonomuraea fuscirosea TaxID=1291556 RepID=A0A2T0LK86_9ACTN|nr:hypothetical protein B0I32_1581 [Nonomuraea fuscirosea]
MSKMSATEAVFATHRTIHRIGNTWMSSRETAEYAAQVGFDDPLAFYFVGRGGAIGDVEPSAVHAAFGFFERGMVESMWRKGITVGSPRDTADRYSTACAAWGEKYLASVPDLTRLVSLAEDIVETADDSGLVLFSAWRARSRTRNAAGRLAQLIHLLREWRGGLHLATTTALGLAPLHAILASDGPGQANFSGWGADLPVPHELKPLRDEAEERTTMLAAAVYEAALKREELAEFVRLVDATGALVLD